MLSSMQLIGLGQKNSKEMVLSFRKMVKLKKELWYFSNTFLFVSVDLDDETEENESKEKVGEENVPLVEEIQVPSGRCLVEEERQAGGQKRTEAWIFQTF